MLENDLYSQTLITNLSDAIVLLDANYLIKSWNPAAKKLLKLVNKRLGQPIQGDIEAAGFKEFLNNPKGTFQCTLPHSHRARRLVMMLLPFAKAGHLLIVKDISQSYRLERMRQDFVANVSHELRTPLTVIHGYLETLLDHSQDQSLRDILTRMYEQTSRMENLVADLLLLSSLENQDPNSPPNQQLTDISALAVTICQDAQSLSQDQHTFMSEIQPHLTIWGEVAALRSAFSNLLTNAVRYTPGGGIITVSCWQDQKQLYFAVSDTGIGIERKHIHRLTERFYRVDKGRSRDLGGTGLGLAIVKHVLLRHKAKLKIESKFGLGSTFCCIFSR